MSWEVFRISWDFTGNYDLGLHVIEYSYIPEGISRGHLMTSLETMTWDYISIATEEDIPGFHWKW